jgi:ketosteroid isomerase-like protein
VEVNVTRVREIYEDFANGRLDRRSDVLDERIDFLSHAPADVFPYLGRRRGRKEVLQALSEVHKKLEVLTFWPITTVVEGNQAALTIVVRIKERATNRSATFLAAHFLRFRNGRVVDCRAIIDSLDAVRQMLRDGETHPVEM